MPEAGRLQWIFQAIDKISPVIRRIQRTISSLRGQVVRHDYWVYLHTRAEPPKGLIELRQQISDIGAQYAATKDKIADYRMEFDRLQQLEQRYQEQLAKFREVFRRWYEAYNKGYITLEQFRAELQPFRERLRQALRDLAEQRQVVEEITPDYERLRQEMGRLEIRAASLDNQLRTLFKEWKKQQGSVEAVLDSVDQFTEAVHWNARAFLEATHLAYIPQRKALEVLEQAYRTLEGRFEATKSDIAKTRTQMDLLLHSTELNEEEYRKLAAQLGGLNRQAMQLQRSLIFLRYVMKYLRSEAAVRELPLGRPAFWFKLYLMLQRVGGAFDRVQRSMARTAWTVTWAGLAMLGAFWSFQMFLTETWGPLERYIKALGNFGDAAFDVATWLAYASDTGQEFAKNIDVGEAVSNVVQVGRQLQATWANVQAMFLYFLATLMTEHPEALQSLVNAFNAFFQFLMQNKDVIAAFITGVGEGIIFILPYIQKLINWVKALGIDFRLLGKIVGAAMVVFMVLGPVLVFLQMAFQNLDAIIILFRTLIAGGGGLIAAIRGAIIAFTALRTVLFVVFTVIRAHPLIFLITTLIMVVFWVYKVTDGFRNWGNLIKAIQNGINTLIGWLRSLLDWLRPVWDMLTGVGRWLGGIFGKLFAFSPLGTAINVYQHVSVGTIRETADADEVVNRLARNAHHTVWGGY